MKKRIVNAISCICALAAFAGAEVTVTATQIGYWPNLYYCHSCVSLRWNYAKIRPCASINHFGDFYIPSNLRNGTIVSKYPSASTIGARLPS